MSETNELDTNNDGLVSVVELETAHKIEMIEKQSAQRQMAWTALIAIIVFTAFMFSPWVPDSKVELLSDVSGMFYVSMATIVGAFMGMTAWMSRK